MSVEAITWAYQQDVVPGAKFVLVTLANYADETGYCYPSQATLAKKTGRSERSVRSHLARLEELGLLERSERRNKKGARTSDAFDLKWDADKRKELPVGEVPTGNSCTTNRQISSDQPADIAGNTNDESSEEPKGEPNARTREAPDEGRLPANAHWKACKPAIQVEVGEADFNSWIDPMIVIKDDGKEMCLSAGSRFWAAHVTENFKAALDRISERDVRVIVHPQLSHAVGARSRAPPG